MQKDRLLKLKTSKKGNIAVTLLSIMVVVMCVVSAFHFLTGSRELEGIIGSPKIIEELKYRENFVEFTIYDTGEDALVETYNEFVKSDKYMVNYIEKNIKGEKYVGFKKILQEDRLSKNFANDFKNKIKSNNNFKEALKSYFFKNDLEGGNLVPNEIEKAIIDFKKWASTSEEKSISKLARDIKNKKIKSNYSINTGILRVNLTNKEFNVTSERINASYKTNISVDFNFSEKGLVNFKDLSKYKEKCLGSKTKDKTEEEATLKRRCYEKNERVINKSGFKVDVKKLNKKHVLLNFTSEKQFFINGKNRRINFQFVPV